jgi:hypothetical protein
MSNASNAIAQLIQAQQANNSARDLVRTQGLEMHTQLPPVGLSSTINNAGQQVNVIPRNVGLLKGFFVEYSATIKNTNASAALTPTHFGPANFFSNIMFTDLQNNTRINCPGYQIAFLNAIKMRGPSFTAALASAMDSAVGFGSNLTAPQWSFPAGGIAAGASGTVSGILHIPISYSDHDLRGAIYSNVINGQMALQFTINPQPAAISAGGDQVLTICTPADNANSVQVLNTQMIVTQVYLDQLPIDPKTGLPILPQRDISTVYELKNTTFSGAVSGSDFPMQYPNFRDVISSIIVFDPLTTVAPTITAVANYYSLQAANSTNIFKRSGNLVAGLTRGVIGCDLPTGAAYFSYRQKPLSTTQYGNLQLIVNPAAGWNATYPIYHSWESFASIATINQAGSLAAG